MKLEKRALSAGLLVLILAAAGRCQAQTSTTSGTTSSSSTSTRSSSSRTDAGLRVSGTVDITDEMKSTRRVVEPMLERLMASRGASPQVRIWAMAIQTQLSEIDVEDFVMLPTLLKQLDDPDETVRLSSISIIRNRILEMEAEEWIALLSPTVLQVAKNAPYTESRVTASKLLAVLGQLEEEDLETIPMLLELVQDKDPDTRRSAIEMVEQKIAESLEEAYLRRAVTSLAVNGIRKSKYPEIKTTLGKLLVALPNIDEQALSSIYLMFELGNDENADVRAVFVETINAIALRQAPRSGGETYSQVSPAQPTAGPGGLQFDLGNF